MVRVRSYNAGSTWALVENSKSPNTRCSYMSSVNTQTCGWRISTAATAASSPPPSPDIGSINSTTNALARRVDQLESARNTDRQADAAVAAAKTGLKQLEERLTAFEAKSDARSASDTARFERLGQELTEIHNISADLADRLPAIERRVGAIGNGRTNGALLAALLRMREAVEAAGSAAVTGAHVGAKQDRAAA